jgi:hypothetical protein
MSGQPSPHSARRRLSLSIRTLMILVAVLGLVAWGYTTKRRWDDYQRRWDDYQRAADRLEWAERMYKKGYVSKAQVESEKLAFKKARTSLGP